MFGNFGWSTGSTTLVVGAKVPTLREPSKAGIKVVPIRKLLKVMKGGKVKRTFPFPKGPFERWGKVSERYRWGLVRHNYIICCLYVLVTKKSIY